MPVSRAWHMFAARIGQEPQIAAALIEAGIEHRYPTVRVERLLQPRNRKPRTETTEEPALPGYMFLNITAAEWNALTAQPIKHLYPTMHWLSRRDVAQMEAFCEHCANMEAIRDLKPGDTIIDAAGWFGDGVLRFIEMVDAARVRARADMMGREVTVEIPADRVRRA